MSHDDVGDGVISAVCGLRWCLMAVGAVVCSVWTAGGDVSFFGVGCRCAGVDVFVVGLVAAVRWRGQQRVQAASCFRPPSCNI